MALTYTGSETFKYGLDVQGRFPLDSRTVVDNFSDLTNYESLFVIDNVATWYVGMEVFAKDTKQKYILVSEKEGFKPVGSNITSGEIDTMISTQINSKLSSIYKFKGSKSSYDELPKFPMDELYSGDVYNIESEFTIGTGENAITYPKGTNVAWVSSPIPGESGHWDPLGGIFDVLNWIEVGSTNENLIED